MNYLSVKEIAALWDISERSVRNYCAAGRVPGAFITGKTWNIPENAEKPVRSNKSYPTPQNLLDVLKEEKRSRIHGGIYHKIQIELTYNSNHIEGSRLTHDQTRFIFETNTVGITNESVRVDDIIETSAHFRCIDEIIDNAKAKLSEKFIKNLHLILKTGTSDAKKDWFAVGDYKKIPNEVGGNETTLPENVPTEMRQLDYMRKKSEIDKAVVTRRIAPSEDLIRKSISLLRDYLGAMDIPSDEDGLIRYVITTFESKLGHYQQLIDNEYSRERYPEREVVTAARDLMQEILNHRKDNVALLAFMVQKQDELLDTVEDLEGIELFFKSQRVIFDSAKQQMDRVSKERDDFSTDSEAQEIFKTISTILVMPKPYGRIGELPALVAKVKEKYDALLDIKRDEVAEIIRQGMQDVHQLAGEARNAGDLLRQADDWFVKKRETLKVATSLTDLDAMITQVLNYKDNICRRMEPMVTPVDPDPKPGEKDIPKPKRIKTVRRYDLCSVKRLQTKEDIDKYVDDVKSKLLNALKDCDELQIN